MFYKGILKMSGPRQTQRKAAPSKENERLFLRKLGRAIYVELYRQERNVDWLSLRTGIARSTLHEIIAGRSNPRILTLRLIAMGLGYENLPVFLSHM